VLIVEDAYFKTDAPQSDNVTVIKAGKTITFQNPGKPFAQVIGVYRDGQKVTQLELDRYKFFPSSPSEAATTVFTPPNPIEKHTHLHKMENTNSR